MKSILKFLIFPITVILVLTGCAQDTTTVTEAKLLISDGPSMDDNCLIDIKEDGTVEYISFKSNTFDFNTKEIEGEVYKKKTIRLSKKNKAIVNELIQKMIENDHGLDGENDWLDTIMIRGFVGDKRYYSIYGDPGPTARWYYDENLAELCYMLVELAPIKIGTYSGLKAPEYSLDD